MTKGEFRRKCVRKELGREGKGSAAWPPWEDSRRGRGTTRGDINSPN